MSSVILVQIVVLFLLLGAIVGFKPARRILTVLAGVVVVVLVVTWFLTSRGGTP